MIIDIHIHEKTYSLDSKIGLEEIVEEARRKGLDGICITDHDSNRIKGIAHQYREKCGFTILVGVEILTFEGDILVFGIDELPNRKMHADQLLDLVTKQGGIGIGAHPYRDNNRGLGDNIKELSNLSGIEVFNGRTEPHNNQKALEISKQFNISGLGGSDAHTLDEVGRYATSFYHKIKTEADFRIKWLETIGSVKKITLESKEYMIIVEKRNYHKSGINYAIGDRMRFMIDMSGVHVIEN